ncbi:hypothetical protein AGMMS50212_10710 [Spirochaetia bacterium]|nr:hypothetical protein AGMMS50212_10710 [Spirochaetia bacterium]
MKKFIFAVTVLPLMFFTACSFSFDVWETRSFTTTKDGFREYYTNDLKNYDTFTIFVDSEKPLPNPNTFEAVAIKKSGAPDVAYCILFCADLDTESYYCLYLWVNGNYQVNKIVDNTTIEEVIEETHTPAIKKGFGMANKIRIVRDEKTLQDFKIYFNDVEEAEFHDDEPLLYNNIGYIVFVGMPENSTESLKKSPVNVLFK